MNIYSGDLFRFIKTNKFQRNRASARVRFFPIHYLNTWTNNFVLNDAKDISYRDFIPILVIWFYIGKFNKNRYMK